MVACITFNVNFMNNYLLNPNATVTLGDEGESQSLTNFLACLVIGNALSPNMDVGAVAVNGSLSTTFRFDLPFALSNLNISPIGFDTRFQALKEFLDKPYVVAGRVVGIVVDPDVDGVAYDFKKDLDNFLRYNIILSNGEVEEIFKTYNVYIGIANGTLTESYAPFGLRDNAIGNGIVAIKIYEPNDLSTARLQDVLTVAGSNSSLPTLGTPAGPIFGYPTTMPTLGTPSGQSATWAGRRIVRSNKPSF